MRGKASGTARLPPTGYRVIAAEHRGAEVKKKLEIDPLHADTLRLALEGDGTTGQLGVKNIVSYLRLLQPERLEAILDHLRALAQRVEVAEGGAPIDGSKSRLLQTPCGERWRKHRAHSGTEVAETEGFEPSIGLYNPITV